MEDDDKRQELLMEGLNDGLQYQLLSHTFASFQLVDKALVIENKRREMEDKKRKF